jgi:hypothetical protein
MIPLLIAAMISFVAGVIGYIMVRYWIGPILAYAKQKRLIAADLAFFSRAWEQSEDPTGHPKIVAERLASSRRHMSAMIDIYHQDLPPWYRIRLQSVGESPDEAAKALMGLNKVHNRDHAAKRLDAIRSKLRIRVKIIL